MRRSKVSEAISGAGGEDWHQLLQPEKDVELEKYQIPVLGEVTFVDP